MAALSLLSVVACAHETGEMKLVRLQAGLDKEFPDHGAPLAIDPSTAAIARAEGSNPPPVPGAPAERVVSTVAPAPEPAAPVVDDPASGAVRPVIHIVGANKARVAGRGPEDHIEMTLPDENAAASAAAGASASTDAAAKQEYDHALALVNAHDWDHALEAFSAYLSKWPDHSGVENALYWSGECYLAKGEVVEAAEEFDRALTRFPQGSKAADSLLKLGVCHQRLGNPDRSKQYFERLVHDFPRSDAARRIPGDHATSFK
jgi:tol-pal system protein YbgF